MEPIYPIFGIIILVFVLIIIPMIINIGTDKKQEWADNLTFFSARLAQFLSNGVVS